MVKSNSLVILDWSGVISNDLEPVVDAVNHVLTNFGELAVEVEEFRRTYASNPYDWYAAKGITDRPRIKALFEEKLDQGTPQQIPGAVQAVREILNLGVKVAILSSHPEEALAREIPQYGLDREQLDVHGGVSKVPPSRKIEGFLKKVSPRDVLYFGDTIVDVNLANHHGIDAVAVASRYGYQPREALMKSNPRYLIESMEEAPDLVRTILQ